MAGEARRIRGTRVALMAVGGVVASTLLAVSPASAAVSAGVGFTVPTAVAVGSTNLNASLTVNNQNNAPNQNESNTINEILFIPSCGSTFSNAANPCSSPDPGVFSISSTGTGAAGTACAGRTFNVSAHPATGGFLFTVVGAPVATAPPGGSAGSDRCTVNFTMNVLKTPSIDSQPGLVGIQTSVNLRAKVTSTSGLMPTPFVQQVITISRGFPTLTTQASPSVAVGGTIFDTATVAKPSPAAANPTGTVTFTVYGPDNASCTGTPVGQSQNPLAGNGTATSTAFAVSQPGIYRFVATYNGDANYVNTTSPCGAPGESVSVTPAPAQEAVADFDGNGTTDLSLFRASNGRWLVRNVLNTVFGVSTDIPVPADFTGDGRADLAVFRPSTGQWFVSGRPTTVWGLSTDIPVPGDYTGDGRADLAVFRPSTGQWFVQGAATVTLGASGDIPVPGDYNGDNRIDRAVFRPSTGQWLVQGMAPVVWGLSTDVPVPGDYTGDNRIDRAVFRPSTGQWFVQGLPIVSLGTSGDIPVPGDYNGDGRTDRAVYRPSTGIWMVQGMANTFWGGTASDIPLPLPYAIRRTIFMP